MLGRHHSKVTGCHDLRAVQLLQVSIIQDQNNFEALMPKTPTEHPELIRFIYHMTYINLPKMSTALSETPWQIMCVQYSVSFYKVSFKLS